MTIHRIPKDKGDLKRGRRVKLPSPHYLLLQPEERRSKSPMPKDYPDKYQIVEVVIEPQPVIEGDKWILNYENGSHIEYASKEIFLSYSPFSPKDEFVLEEDYLDLIGTEIDPQFYIRRSEWDEADDQYLDWQPSSTMPAHLNSFIVDKVIGVVKRELCLTCGYDGYERCCPEPEFLNIWKYQLLVIKKIK